MQLIRLNHRLIVMNAKECSSKNKSYQTKYGMKARQLKYNGFSMIRRTSWKPVFNRLKANWGLKSTQNHVIWIFLFNAAKENSAILGILL